MSKDLVVIADLPAFSIVEHKHGFSVSTEPGWYTPVQLKAFLLKWHLPASVDILDRLATGDILELTYEYLVSRRMPGFLHRKPGSLPPARDIYKAWQKDEGNRHLFAGLDED
ncbi:hypothetical protein [Sinomonas sp. B1-1]|uniref:hypothetical protein n=1 Tax=Sinomonas sp. B1-1 TaxID=3141454 RepID=UPI003D2E2D41